MDTFTYFQNPTLDYHTANNDFAGIQYAASRQEIVTYQKDTTVRVWYNQQPDAYAMHWHNAMEMIMPIENYYNVTVNDRYFKVETGEIMIIPPGELHEMAPPETGGTRFVYLMDIRALSGLKGFGSIQPLLTAPIYIQPSTYPDIYQDVCEILAKISDVYFGRGVYAELTIYSLLLELFVKLGSNYNNTRDLFPNTQTHKQEEYIHKFNELLEYIDSHYTENLTLEDMAALVGFSKFHFSRLFKRYTDYTFCDYLCRRRIKAAEELLSYPNLSITEVAMQAGFPSISTFNRLFREQKKCTPSEYRAKNNQRGFSRQY